MTWNHLNYRESADRVGGARFGTSGAEPGSGSPARQATATALRQLGGVLANRFGNERVHEEKLKEMTGYGGGM